MLIAAIALLAGLQKMDELQNVKVPKGDLEIRYWEDGGLVHHRSLYVFRRKHGAWAGTYQEIPLRIIECATDTQPTGPAPKALEAPAWGWDGWWKKLKEQDFLTLPNYDDLPGPKDEITDAGETTVEINNGGRYRKYAYPDPSGGNWPEVKKFRNIERLMRDAFHEQLDPAIVEINIHTVKSNQVEREGKRGSWEKIFFGSAKDPQTIVGREAMSKLPDLRTYSLPKGDLEIRFWQGFGITYLQGYVFKRTADQWSASYLLPATAEFKKIGFKMDLRPPRFGWDAWWTKLSMLDILTLPDFESLPGQKATVLDGMSYVVEINQDGHYRTYMYDNPDSQPKLWPEVRKMQQIVRFLADQFQNQLPG